MAVSSGVALTVAIPAYGEAVALRELLPALRAQVQALGVPAEILIVDARDAVDDTASVCAENGVRHVHRRGGERYGDAVRTAIADARGDVLLFMDADGSHAPSTVATLWAARGRGDVIVGSRYVSGGATTNPSTLIGMSLALNFVFRTAFALDCRDVTNSLRLYDTGVLDGLTLDSDNFDILQEILIKISARRPRGTIVEVPIVFHRRVAGESKRKLLPFVIAYLSTIVRLWRFRRAR